MSLQNAAILVRKEVRRISEIDETSRLDRNKSSV
jgi:hypothetical protein